MTRDQRIARTRQWAAHFDQLERKHTDLPGHIGTMAVCSRRKAVSLLTEAGVWPYGPWGAPEGYTPYQDPETGRWHLKEYMERSQ